MSAIALHDQCMFLHLNNEANSVRNFKTSKILQDTSSIFKCPLRQFPKEWIGPQDLAVLMNELKQYAKTENRPFLLVSGLYLEDQVTVCVLEALLEGFDVHLLCDIIWARDVKLKPVLLLRLFQAGAVPSSLRQFLYMWLASEVDQHITEDLRKLLEDYDSAFAVRPR